ncbi:MAG TPA: GNAT family N-acetyltransferase [Candidatus Binatia bacterium]|nr:GNAT family N-acetyltransferase [Candidatus Binatia bacterium]
MITVNRVLPGDENAAVGTIVAAFRGDPVAQWFYPDSQQYLEVFPTFVKAFAGAAFAHDAAYCSQDYAAAALWLPPGIHPDEKTLVAILEDTISEPRQPEVGALLEQMDHHHPSEPHWYLPMIGVVPDKQGRGYGSALLKHALQQCDAAQALAYLEASTSKSVPLYQRHGFERVGTIQVGSSPPLFPMIRKPRRLQTKEKSDAFCAANS